MLYSGINYIKGSPVEKGKQAPMVSDVTILVTLKLTSAVAFIVTFRLISAYPQN